ncbi:DNA translocase FtsK [Opacimonas viscosa]|uniref:DNA translocase FtsK n=1 Tax=Opacimonas viscosa TaxID=2961944 RepID=A0AA42BK73_9ALTE|nr:DNA translocase FtsK 4TM domain-containing protein [Opacimonas viscosa]MCP3427433.1 DNA translocase FtsK 4TM domain-containing protein [Opacimonas viscosa]
MTNLSGTQRIYETFMIVFTIIALFLFLALMSFHQADPGWSQTGLQPSIQNWMGPVGAKLADLCFFTFGFLAYTLPFGFAFLGWFAFQQVKNILQLDFLNIGLRVIGLLFVVIGLSGLASINFDDMYYFSAGGLFGDVISQALLPYFNLTGTTLLLLAFFLTGFTLLSGISWITVVDSLGACVIWSIESIYIAPKKLWQNYQQKAALRREQHAQLKAEKAAQADAEFAVSIATLKPAKPSVEDRPFNIKQETLYTANDTLEEEVPNISTIAQDTEVNLDEMTLGDIASDIRQEPSLDNVIDTPVAHQSPTVTMVNSPLVKTKVIDPHAEKPEGERPSFALLDRADKVNNPITQEELDGVSRLVEEKLADFNIEAKVVGVFPGPVITRFELDLAPGVKVSKITTLSKDLARAMSAISVRVVEVIPGKSVIGLELPNKNREMVRLSEVIECDAFQSSSSDLTMVLGADISGKPVIVDLAKMPHVLVAGTTGSGKSVGVNVMILSLLYKSSPEDVRMIMIDPKMLELSVYEGIPHLLAEVVTDMKEAANALRWCVGEMERRYRLMSALGVRNLKGFNAKVLKAIEDGAPIKDPLWQNGDSMDTEAPDLTKLPAIVVVVDEFADMMMIVGKKVEELIARIAQKARAAGIHLVLATQRPSVDVITGLIKANIPTRIAFQVSSKIDSRTILDQQGAETLLGMGDMLYLPPGTGVPTRVHGAFVDDHEVHAVVGDWKKRGEPEYIDEILNGEASTEILLPGEQPEGGDQEFDVFYDEAVAFVTETRKASVSSVQRKFRIGYNRAARLVEQMEQSGVVSAPGHNGNREVLAPPAPRD